MRAVLFEVRGAPQWRSRLIQGMHGLGFFGIQIHLHGDRRLNVLAQKETREALSRCPRSMVSWCSVVS